MLRTFAIATTTVALLSGAAFAADLTIPETPYLPETTGVSWDGLYAGVGVGGYFQSGYDSVAHISGVFGVNAIVESSFVIGAELEADYMFENDDFAAWVELWLKGRAGVLVSPDLLVYGVAGAGVWADESDNSGTHFGLGLGIEAAVSDSISLRGEVLAVKYSQGSTAAEAKASILFHF
jgi:opacity protein-like surface antigen